MAKKHEQKAVNEPSPTEAILESISDGVFTVDREWRVTSFNRAAEEITGIPREEALGRLGTQRALVVHGSDGLDEITTRGLTRAGWVEDGSFRDFQIDPREHGIEPASADALLGGDSQENAQILRTP